MEKRRIQPQEYIPPFIVLVGKGSNYFLNMLHLIIYLYKKCINFCFLQNLCYKKITIRSF